jgi:hypothetical protein
MTMLYSDGQSKRELSEKVIYLFKLDSSKEFKTSQR